MAEKVPGEMTVHASDSLRDNVCGHTALCGLAGGLGKRHLPLSYLLYDPLGKNEMMTVRHHPCVKEEPTLFTSTRVSLKAYNRKYDIQKMCIPICSFVYYANSINVLHLLYVYFSCL